MNSLLLISQLLIPQLPAEVNEDNFIEYTIKTFDCVADVEKDGIVYALADQDGEESAMARLIVTAKDESEVAACAEELTSSLEGLKLETIFSIIPAFVVSYEVPDLITSGDDSID